MQRRRNLIMTMNRCELLSVMSRYHVIYRLMGLAPFNVDKSRLQLRRSSGTVVYAAAVLVSCLIATAYVIHFWCSFAAKKYTLRIIWMQTSVVLYCMGPLTSVAADLFSNTCKFQRILKLFSYRDTNLLHFRQTSNTYLSNDCKFILSVTLTLLPLLTLAFFWAKQHVLYVVVTILLRMVSSATVLRYMVLVRLVQSDVCNLNKCLRSSSRGIWQCSSQESRYWLLRRVYSALCNVSEEVLSVHDVPLALSMAALSWHMASLVLYMQQGQSVLMQTVVVIYHVLLQFRILFPSHALQREAALTARLVCKRLLDVRLTSSEVVELRRLWRLADGSRIVHHIFGILPLDLRLLVAYLSAWTTYTVVLITFL